MLPELGDHYGVSTGAASTSITAYLLPFAALMLVSGTLGERWGRRRTVLTGYAVYVAASSLCVLAPTWTLFLGGRALQGAANAFTTPLLLAVLAGAVEPARLGRALGWFGSFQAAGQTSAPLVGGLAAEVDWRLAFAGVGVVALVLGLAGLPETPRASDGSRPPSLRSAWRPVVVRAGLAAAVGWGCLAGLNFLLALRLEDAFALSPGARGGVLTGLGVAGMLTARVIGGAVDRVGARRCVLAGALSGAVLVAGVGIVPVLGVVVALWTLAGVSSQLVLVGVNALVLGEVGSANTGGAMSVVQALRFGGGSLAPVGITPVYHADPVVGFVAPAALLAAGVPALLAGRRRTPTS
ncbi:MAG: MFS transporter [Actinomycetota bacterium]|nr:MFS transporter [Actinomycetota bacterium]